jgi:Ni/Co efflux regulator RcnB
MKMFKQKYAAAAAALLLATTSLGAFAQPGPRGPQHDQGHGPQRMHQRAPAPHAAPQRPMMQPPHAGHPHGMPPGQAKRMGAGPQHNWVKGARMPKQYRTQHYVVNDWRRHGLKQPPRGQQWVQYGGDYLLVAIATGVITQLILGH